MTEDGVIDLRRQLLSELREELGLAADTVSEARPLCIVEHPGSHVSDLGMALVTRLSAEAVLETRQSRGNTEYDRVIVVQGPDWQPFSRKQGRIWYRPRASS